MQHKHEVFNGSHEGYNLLANKEGNNGRSMRRFLRRASASGIVHQVFAYESMYSTAQLDEIEAFAASLVKQDAAFIPPEAGRVIGIIREDAFGLVQNSYELAYPVDTASVKQLREMVHLVTVLYDGMHAYACNPNDVALHLYPDYQYRGLANSCSEEPWCISGVDGRQCAAGVLEWCVDEDDATLRLANMSKHLRFSHLKAESWASLRAEH